MTNRKVKNQSKTSLRFMSQFQNQSQTNTFSTKIETSTGCRFSHVFILRRKSTLTKQIDLRNLD